MLYARLATGYRPGGPNVVPPGAPSNVPRQYGSDSTTNVELGIRTTQADGRVSIDLAAFNVDWKNIQLLEYIGAYGVDGNGGTARSQGLEMDLDFMPVSGLTLKWVGAYTDAQLTSPAPAVNGVSGDPLPFAPKWSTAVDGEYDFPVFAGFKGFVGVTWSYVGSRSTDFASSAGLTPTQTPLSGYTTEAARIGIDNAHYTVEIFGKNLSDARGITNYVSSGAPNLEGEINIIQPMTLGLTVAAKF
jgi:outer membrane receptor protein involved in Fe transport